AAQECPRPVHRIGQDLGRGYRPRLGHPKALDPHSRRLLAPAVKALAKKKLARSGRRRQPVRAAPRSADQQLEAAVPSGLQLLTEQVGLGDVAEGFVKTGPVGARLQWRTGALHGEVQEPRGPPVTADSVDRLAIDPGLLVDEVGTVTAELAEWRTERVDHRKARVARLQSQVKSLAEILGQKTEGVRAVQRGRRVVVLEDALTGLLQPFAEALPCGTQRFIIPTISKSHRRTPLHPTRDPGHMARACAPSLRRPVLVTSRRHARPYDERR